MTLLPDEERVAAKTDRGSDHAVPLAPRADDADFQCHTVGIAAYQKNAMLREG
jgi:hypothetical protein